ncbi:MAG TPA: hypothetical protein VG937_07270 [Polyangiaceae bacterium]|nr:hypothetical protein [Polyangiaceae bacterium]
MAQHILHSYSGSYPFPLVKKPRSSVAELRALRIRIWLARVVFALLFAGVLALLVYEIQTVRQIGWHAAFRTWL